MRALLSYILTRILLTIPMIFILLTLVFFIIRVMPGDPVKSMLGAHAPKETMDEVRHQLGLDKPIIDFSTNNQFVDYMSAFFHGDLGQSLWYRVPVTTKIAQYFPATLELSFFALLFAVVLGVATGAFAAHKRKSAADYSIRLFGITSYSIPVFWLGLMLQMIFGVAFDWFPIAGRISARVSPQVITGLYVIDGIITLNFEQVASALWHLVLPATALGLILCGIFIRLTRANMLDVLKQDYVLAANARGIPSRRVVYKHALKNAFVPILTMMGLEFAYLMSGAVLTETTFSWPGMGSFLVESVNYRDFPALQGTIIFIALLVMGISLVVDILYAIIDPRVRY
jgi:peptide/nickel transport system permease protein